MKKENKKPSLFWLIVVILFSVLMGFMYFDGIFISGFVTVLDKVGAFACTCFLITYVILDKIHIYRIEKLRFILNCIKIVLRERDEEIIRKDEKGK